VSESDPVDNRFGISIGVSVNGTLQAPGSEGISAVGQVCLDPDPQFPSYFICPDLFPGGSLSPAYALSLDPGVYDVTVEVFFRELPQDPPPQPDGIILRSVETFVGNAPPSLSLAPDLSPPDYPVDEGQTLAIALTASDPNEDDLAFTVGNAPSGSELVDNGDGTASFSWTPALDQAGSYPNVIFTVTDDGNPLLSDSRTVTILVGETATPPPVLDPIGDREVSELEQLLIALSASDPNEFDLAFSVADAPTGSSLTDNGDGTAEFLWTPTSEQAGNYDVLFTVTNDGSPPASAREQITITVGNVNRPPTLDPIGSRVGAVGEPLEIALTASDPDLGDTLAFAVSDAPAGSDLVDNNDGSAVFSWTPDSGQAGGYSVTFSVTDDGETDGAPDPLTDAETVSIQIGDGNRPPVLAPIGSRQVEEEEELRIVLTASDPDGGALSFSAEDLPQGASFVDNGDGTAQFAWTPETGSQGEYPVTFTVADDGDPPLTDAETVLIEVLPLTNRQPTLSVQGATVVNEGAAMTLTANATDPDGDELTITAQGLPAGSTFVDNGNGSAVFSWIPSVGQQGTYPVTFTAADNGEPPADDRVSVSLQVFGAGDVDRDGQVDGGDVDRILDQLGTVTGGGNPADVDQDGVVTIHDARQAAISCSNPDCALQ
jgi:hypothetical protein